MEVLYDGECSENSCVYLCGWGWFEGQLAVTGFFPQCIRICQTVNLPRVILYFQEKRYVSFILQKYRHRKEEECL